MEFKVKKRLSAIKKYRCFNHAHLEIRRGTIEEARTYCCKLDTRISGPWTIGNISIDPTPDKTAPKTGSGKRNDIAAFLKAIRSGMHIHTY